MNKTNYFIYRWSRLLLLLLVLVLVFCLSGCGESKVDLNTKIIIDPELSGSRTMTLSLSAEDFATILGFSTDNLETVLSKSCPKELSWKSKTDDGIYYCTFSLDFTSLKDYRAKVKAITGKKAKIKLVDSARLFSNGITYNENFHSEDLFQWMIKALKKEGYIDQDTDSIFNIGSTVINYDNKDYSLAGDQAKVDTLQLKGAKRVDICTSYHEDNLCDRDLLIYFDEETISSMGQIIKDRLSSRCPEGAELTWDTIQGDSYCCFHKENMDSAQLDDFMKTILTDSESFVHGEGVRRPSTFTAFRDWNETLDVSLLTLEDRKDFKLGYYVKWDKGVSITVHNQNEGDAISLSDSDLYPGYQRVFERNILSKSLKTEFHVNYGIETIQVKDTFSKKQKLSREIRFLMDSKLSDEDLGAIYDSMKDSAKDQAEVSLEEGENGNSLIVVKTSQGIHVANQSFRNMFGVEGQTVHEVNQKLLELKHPGSLSVVLDFSLFIGDQSGRVKLEYDAKLPRLESVVDPDNPTTNIKAKNGKITIEKNQIHASVKGAYLELSVDTETGNGDGLYLVLMLICLSLIIAAIRLLPPVTGKIMRQAKKGPRQLKEAYEGYNEEDQTILQQRYESEMRRKNRDKLLREQWRDQETSHDGGDTSASVNQKNHAGKASLVTTEKEIFLSDDKDRG